MGLPINGNGEQQELWYDDNWDAWVWTSGNCPTEVEEEGFDNDFAENVPEILDKVEEITGERPQINGGHEDTCHNTGSRHYSGEAIDIDSNGWSTSWKDDFREYLETELGYHYFDEGGHVHVATAPSGGGA